jgi:hypothetical protein
MDDCTAGSASAKEERWRQILRGWKKYHFHFRKQLLSLFGLLESGRL